MSTCSMRTRARTSMPPPIKPTRAKLSTSTDWRNSCASAICRWCGLTLPIPAPGMIAGFGGTRSDGPDALQNIKVGTRRSQLDDRLTVDPARDTIINKRMASAFHETHLPSLLNFHRIDTVIVTGGSTSGCVRATAVDSLSHGFRTIVPEECTADRHEGPHFANLYDLKVKYADVVP